MSFKEEQEREALIEKQQVSKRVESMDTALTHTSDLMPSYIPKNVNAMLRHGTGKSLEQLKKEQQDPNQTFFKDSEGREFANKNLLQGEILEEKKKKAIQDHQNDMEKRLRNGGFPLSKNTLEFCLAEPVSFSGGNPKYKLAPQQKEMREAFAKGLSIFAFGEVGGGKTSTSIRLAANWMKEDPTRQAYFIPMAAWFDDLFTSDNLDKAFAIKKKELSNARLVCLDDFDKIPMGEWANKKLFMLIDMFYSRGTQVIITSNRGLVELSNHPKANVDFDSVADRITGECGSQGVIEFKHKSFR